MSTIIRIHRLLLVLLAVPALVSGQARPGAVVGRIMGIDGAPTAGVRVAVITPGADGKVSADVLIAIATTESDGRYRIDGVPAGRYRVIAGAIASPTYFPGTSIVEEATPITVAAGTTTEGTNFSLARSPAPEPLAPDNP